MFSRVAVLLAVTLAIGKFVPGDVGPAGAAEWGPSESRYVIVRLRTPEALRPGTLDRAAVAAQVHASQERVLSSLPVGEFNVTHRYNLLPAVAGTLSQRGARVLAGHPDVASIDADRQGQGALGESVPMINANDVHALGYTGAGTVVAVIDSGVDTNHPDLADSLIHHECFMANPALGSRCPNGSTYQVGPGAAQDDHGHGTNVTGIITSNGTVAPRGVAPAAQIEAFKIIDVTNRFWFSDLDAVLDHILNAHPEVDFINMSLGTFDTFPPGSCESGSFLYDRLRANGVLSFVASMNNGAKSTTGYPACVASAIAVGAVYDSNVGPFFGSPCSDASTAPDQVACWSNSSSSLDLLGPGCRTSSTGRFGSISTYCGTSQATPHAAGAAALLLGGNPTLNPDQVERSLESRGVAVTDAANGIARPRVDVLAAFDYDLDGLLNPSDPDDDNDGLADGLETICGSDTLQRVSLPERIDTLADDDGDTLVNEALPPGAAAYDCDGDGYAGAREANATTSDQDPCGGSGWPSDVLPGGLFPNSLTVQDVGSFVTPVRRLGTSLGHPDFSARWDLMPGSVVGATTNVQDIIVMVTGASGYPPMFGGQWAFGRTCPYAP